MVHLLSPFEALLLVAWAANEAEAEDVAAGVVEALLTAKGVLG